MDDKKTMAWFGAFVIVVLLIGIASGVLLDRFLIRPPGDRVGRGGPLGAGQQQRMPGRGMRQGPAGAAGPGGPAAGLRPGLEERLAQQLDLTAAQKEKVKAILEQRRARLDEVRAETQKRVQKEQEDLRAEIRALLTDAQKKKFDEVIGSTPGFGLRGPGERGMRLGGPPAGRD